MDALAIPLSVIGSPRACSQGWSTARLVHPEQQAKWLVRTFPCVMGMSVAMDRQDTINGHVGWSAHLLASAFLKPRQPEDSCSN